MILDIWNWIKVLINVSNLLFSPTDESQPWAVFQLSVRQDTVLWRDPALVELLYHS